MDREIQNVIEKCKKDKEVLAVALFGSAARNEENRDTDLCVFLNTKMSNLEMSRKLLEFSKNAGKGIDIIIFQQLPVYVRMRVIKEGKIIFCRNEDELYEIAFSTIKEFGFYEKLYKMYLNEVENGQRKNFIKV